LCACAAALLFSTRSAISSRPLSCNSMQAHRINTRSSKRQRIIGKSPSTRSTRRPRDRFFADGRFLCMMNNLRENNCSVFSAEDPDRALEEDRACRGPVVEGQIPQSVPHGLFSRFQEALPVGAASSARRQRVMVVDTSTWNHLEGNPRHRPGSADPGTYL